MRLVNLSSEQVTPGWTRRVRLLWIDGDHSYEGVRRDLTAWQPFLLPECQIVFDDLINPDIGPRRLIDELIAGGNYKQVRQVGKISQICLGRP